MYCRLITLFLHFQFWLFLNLLNHFTCASHFNCYLFIPMGYFRSLDLFISFRCFQNYILSDELNSNRKFRRKSNQLLKLFKMGQFVFSFLSFVFTLNVRILPFLVRLSFFLYQRESLCCTLKKIKLFNVFFILIVCKFKNFFYYSWKKMNF